jgi:TatD DNase family protein
MEWIDTHAHIYDPVFKADQKQVIERSMQAGITRIYLPSLDITTIDSMLAIEEAYAPLCAAMIGLHPCYIADNFEQHLAQIAIWLQQRTFVAIGEVGMDLYHDRAYEAQQKVALVAQIKWAKEYQLPLVIHCRNAFQQTLHLLEKHQDGSLQGIFHCFTGDLFDAQRILDLGFYIGIGGISTFKNSGLRAVVAKISLEKLVLETDSPYLAPVPYRGKRNEPSYLPYIGAQLATLHQVDINTVANLTTANAKQVFGS